MRRSNDLARRLIVLVRRDRGVRINHGQEKRGADYERKYVLISLGERHLRQGEGPDEAHLLELCSQCFRRRRNVGGFIARRMCKDDLADLPPKLGRRGNHRASRRSKARRWN
jgi:hypothetical protein